MLVLLINSSPSSSRDHVQSATRVLFARGMHRQIPAHDVGGEGGVMRALFLKV